MFEQLLQRISVALDEAGIPYMIIGGQALQRTRKVKMGNVHVKFASPEDLIVHKVIAGRPRDLEDVKAVLIKNPEMDLTSIHRWLKEFSAALQEPFVNRFDELIKQVEQS